MKMAVTVAGVVCVALVTAGVAAGQVSSAEFQRRQRKMRSQYERQTTGTHERRAAEMRAQHERRAAEMKAEFARRTAEAKRLHKLRRRPVPFDPAAAPPAACLKLYIAAAASARSMEDLYRYLPLAEKRSADESREWNRKPNSETGMSALSRPANPARDDQYARNQVARHKRIAGKILDVFSVKINGNKAVLKVSTTVGGKFNGVEYPYGKATIEMLGEGAFWKVDRYNDSSVVYMNPP